MSLIPSNPQLEIIIRVNVSLKIQQKIIQVVRECVSVTYEQPCSVYGQDYRNMINYILSLDELERRAFAEEELWLNCLEVMYFLQPFFILFLQKWLQKIQD